MRRFISASLAVAALASTFVLGTLPASAQHAMGHERCPRGSHWVPPHRDRHGRWVRGHCDRR